jgi:hypothetical protein
MMEFWAKMEWAAELEIWIDFQGLDFKSKGFKYFQTYFWTEFKIDKIQITFSELFKSGIWFKYSNLNQGL